MSSQSSDELRLRYLQRMSRAVVTEAIWTWVCSNCVRERYFSGIGRRARFPHEECPLCTDPGVGMVMVENQSIESED